MAKINVTKDLINSIANQNNKKFVKNVNKTVNQILALSIEALSKKVSYINLKNVVLQPMNELLNNSFVDNSNCIYFLGIENAQLELNTSKKLNFWRNLKERFLYAWSSRKLFKRRRRKRKRKKDKELITSGQEINKVKFDPSKYSIYDLTEDLQTCMCNFLSETSLISRKNNCLQIFGRDDFGSISQVIIYLVSYSENTFKFFKGNAKKYIEINVNSRIDKVSNKLTEAGENFIKIMKIINTLYYNINGRMPNQIFIESALCFVPSELYQGDDIYKVYLKVINYLRIKSVKGIKSINNPELFVNEDDVCGHCGIEFNKMLNLIN